MFRRRLRLPAVAGAGLLIAATAATLGTPATAAPADDPAVQVTIDSFGPTAPKPGQPVLIKGTIRNTSTETIQDPQALACIDRTRLSTAAEIAEISPEQNVAPNDQNSCSRLTTPDSGVFQEFDDPLAPDASVQFSLTVPWNEWRITKQTGVYVVGVVVRGTPQDQGRATIGRARTLMPVIGTQPLTRKVKTALVIPLRHRPTLLGGKKFTNDSLAEAMAPTGRLGKLLALGRQRKVTWLVDPAMLDEARRMRDGYEVGESKPTTGTGQRVAAAWLQELDASLARGNQVVLLPYGDPDVAGLLDAGDPLKDLVRDARIRSEGFNLSPYGFTNGLWLEGGAAASRYLAAASTGFPGATANDVNLVSSASWPAAEQPSLTSTSPVYDIRTPEGPRDTVRTVVADAALTSGGPDADTDENPLQVRQRFAAETALMAASGKGTASVVAVPARGWDSDGRATAALAADLSLPWINATSVDEVVTSTPKPPAVKAPAAPRTNATMTADQLDDLNQLDQATTTLENLLADPQDLPENMPQALLRVASTSWRGFPDEARRYAEIELGSVNGQLGKVHLVNNVANGERREIKVNLAGSKGTFPLTITNETDWSVRVGIVVTPSTRTDLRIEPQQTRILAPKQKYTPRINASAEQNGLIRANAQVITASGRPVGKSEELLIQASQYGSVGWILVGAACALLFGTSFVRIYRRVRTERRSPSAGPSAEAEAAATVDPLHPEPLDPPPAGTPADETLREGVGSKDG
ncbi:hypothetical protein AB0E63_08960 [Kribbella sp. NPDC026596]|uniref:hypothetical protein n=1 Tax=Kribbella sp. NPDC026596 TaxID=3155122 RepID=UPI0033EDC16E